MPIRRYVEDSAAFEPEVVRVLSEAFEQVCAELKVAAAEDRFREAIAVRIIELARNGLIDATALRERVLSEARTDAE
jgi:hypothetical protein